MRTQAHPRRRSIEAALAASLVLAALAPPAASAQAEGLKRTQLSRNDLAAEDREALQVLVEFGPDVFAGRHSHPGEELVYVVEGVLEYRLDGRPPIVLRKGDALFIPRGAVHAVKNVGKGAGAELATYIVDKGKPLLVPAE
jgi:quercetin dioxygenase-like cupin family protein